MKKDLNFSQLENLKAPEEWIEKAMSIPNENHSLTAFRHWRAVGGTAAAIIVAVTVVLTLVINTRSPKPPLDSLPGTVTQPTTAATELPDSAPQPPQTSVAAVTDPKGNVTATEIVPLTSAAPSSSATMAATAKPSAATEAKTDTTAPFSSTASTIPETLPAKTSPSKPLPETTAATQTASIIETVDVAGETEWFEGTVTLRITAPHPFLNAETVFLRVDSDEGFCGITAIKPDGSALSVESDTVTTEVCFYDTGTFVPADRPCTVTVYDKNGNRAVFSTVFHNGQTVIFDV